MNRKQQALSTVVALIASMGAVVSVQAQALGQHPAVLAHQAVRAIDPNTFIVAHPAQVTLKGGHAGHDHPALAARQDTAAQGIDANTFLVQPPASTTWTHDARPPVLVASVDKR